MESWDIQPDGSDSENTCRYFATLPELSELSQVDNLRLELETDYGENNKVIFPLRKIFKPQQLSDHMYSKVFAVDIDHRQLTEEQTPTPTPPIRERMTIRT